MDMKKDKDIHVHGLKISIIKMAVLPKAICKFTQWL